MNIAKILKYCPKGTKLYSTVFGEAKFSEIYPDDMIVIIIKDNSKRVFHKDGSYFDYGECVLFPSKDQRNWSKFRLPVKRGDIMMSSTTKRAFITSGVTINGRLEYICGINVFDTFQIVGDHSNDTIWTSDFCIPASEEAKKELFDKMAEAGYKWNADTLELEKIESKFKEGDIISSKSGNLYLVANINNRNVVTAAVLYADGDFIPYNIYHTLELKNFDLASEEERNKFYSILVKEGFKYDKKQHLLIKQKFKPFDKVLVRNNDKQKWIPNIFLRFTDTNNFKYLCLGNLAYAYCIPYEGNEYLLGTTDSPI